MKLIKEATNKALQIQKFSKTWLEESRVEYIALSFTNSDWIELVRLREELEDAKIHLDHLINAVESKTRELEKSA